MGQDGYSEACCLGGRNRAVIPRDPARADPTQTFPPYSPPPPPWFAYLNGPFGYLPTNARWSPDLIQFPYTVYNPLPFLRDLLYSCFRQRGHPPALPHPPRSGPLVLFPPADTGFALFIEELVLALPRAPQRTQGQRSVPRRWSGGSKVGTTGGLPGSMDFFCEGLLAVPG